MAHNNKSIFHHQTKYLSSWHSTICKLIKLISLKICIIEYDLSSTTPSLSCISQSLLMGHRVYEKRREEKSYPCYLTDVPCQSGTKYTFSGPRDCWKRMFGLDSVHYPILSFLEFIHTSESWDWALWSL